MTSPENPDPVTVRGSPDGQGGDPEHTAVITDPHRAGPTDQYQNDSHTSGNGSASTGHPDQWDGEQHASGPTGTPPWARVDGSSESSGRQLDVGQPQHRGMQVEYPPPPEPPPARWPGSSSDAPAAQPAFPAAPEADDAATGYVQPIAAPIGSDPARPRTASGPFDQPTVRTDLRVEPQAGQAQAAQAQAAQVRYDQPLFAQPEAVAARQQAAGPRVRTPRVPRRASLQLKRLDPWSVLKLSLVLSVAGFLAWMVAVGVLYGVLGGMGVWDQLNGTYSDFTAVSDPGSEDLISAGRVFSVAAVVGAVNIVLITALSTVGAFIYNVSADMAGGIELTLSESD